MDHGAVVRLLAPAGQCEEGFQLRSRLVKLRWLGLEREAERVAAEIAALGCGLPKPLPPRIDPTD